MHFDGGFFQASFDEEVKDLAAMVSLELDDLAHFLILDNSTIASEMLGKFTDQMPIDRYTNKTIDTFLKAFKSLFKLYSIVKLVQTV